MSEKRKEEFEREDSPIINVCDTTTAIAVTSENIDQNEVSSNHIPFPKTYNFHLQLPYLPQPLSSIPNLSTTMSHPDKLLTGKSTGNIPGRSFQTTPFHGGIQKYHEELRSESARDKRKDTGNQSKHLKSKRQSETEFRHIFHSIYEQHGSSSDDDGEPDRKIRRCLGGERSAGQDRCETSTDEPATYEMTTTRSKVPEEIRLRINSRERQRMHDLNSALDSLRQVMPYSSGPAVKKLSKMSTLLLARNYIVMLTKSVEDMKRLIQELSANQRLPHQVPLPTILHETSISNPLLTTNISGIRIPTPYLQSATAMQCISSSQCTTCTCLQCLKKRQSANAAALLMGWKPG